MVRILHLSLRKGRQYGILDCHNKFLEKLYFATVEIFSDRAPLRIITIYLKFAV